MPYRDDDDALRAKERAAELDRREQEQAELVDLRRQLSLARMALAELRRERFNLEAGKKEALERLCERTGQAESLHRRLTHITAERDALIAELARSEVARGYAERAAQRATDALKALTADIAELARGDARAADDLDTDRIEGPDAVSET